MISAVELGAIVKCNEASPICGWEVNDCSHRNPHPHTAECSGEQGPPTICDGAMCRRSSQTAFED